MIWLQKSNNPTRTVDSCRNQEDFGSPAISLASLNDFNVRTFDKVITMA
jgi:hypothetical protein